MSQLCIDGDRAYELLKRLGPARLGGSNRESEAAQILVDEIRGLGLQPTEETFTVQTFAEASAQLEVLSPFQAAIACKAIGLSGNTPPEGMEAPLVYAESGGSAYLSDAGGKFPLIFGRLNALKYEALATEGALGFVCIGDPGKRATLNMLEINWIKRWGKRPGAFICFEDGLRLIREDAQRVRLVVQQREFEANSRNVAVDIPGTKCPDEVILIGAHFDSHRDMDGAHDNGAGTVEAMELLRHFVAHPARRTLRFVWFGSEELGCRGSRAYVERHTNELDNVIFMLNLDLGGGIIGQDAVDVMGPPESRMFFELLDKERGLDLQIQEKVYGGDNAPFLEVGIPAVAIYRGRGTSLYIHTPDDRLDLVDGRHLAQLAELAVEFLDRAANAYRFPFKREVPESIQEKLRRMREEYFGLPDRGKIGESKRG
jgi:aminopeptidase YwaD